MNMVGDTPEPELTGTEKKAKRPKRPTFERVRKKKDLPPFRLEETDVDLLAAHGRHRVLDTDQLARLVGREKRRVLHRLYCLHQHGYIIRPKSQIPTPAHMGKGDGRPVLSVLSRKGLVVLAERRGFPGQTFDPAAGKGSLEHERGASEVMLRLELGAGPERELAWWHEMAPAFPEHRDRKGDRFRVRLRFAGQDHALWLRPDRYVTMIDRTKPEEKSRKAFLLEKDRGTMPLERPSLAQSSILRKLLGYSRFYIDRTYAECFGFRGFRVLFVTESKQRCENMRALYRKYEAQKKYNQDLAAQRMFWFCDMATIKAYDNIFDVPWLLADGTTVRLSD